MSDTKTVFGKDGSYSRVNRVDELDVAATKAAGSPDSTAGDVSKTSTAARKKVKSKQNTFNLGALRAAAHKASSSVSSTKLPAAGEPSFSSVETRGVPSGPSKEQAAGMPNWTDKKAESLAAEAEALINEKKPEPAPTPSVGAPKETHTTESVEPAAEVVAQQSPIEEPFNSNTSSVETLSVSKLEIEQVSEVSTTTEEAEPSPVFTDEGFRIVSLDRFLKIVGWSDQVRLARWLVACVKASVSYPGLVLEHASERNLRFYNYIYEPSGSNIVVAVGVVQDLAVLRLDVKNRVVADMSAKASSSPDMVTVNGVPIVFYEERLHKTRKV